MVIKASAAAEIRQLIAQLDDDEVGREAAIARLAIIGERAAVGLVAAFRTAARRETRIAILRALERTSDDRSLAVAREALALGGDVAVAAVGVLRALLDNPTGRTGAEALDSLMGIVLDPAREHRLRHAAAAALEDVPEVRDQVAVAITGLPEIPAGFDTAGGTSSLAATWADAVEGRLPEDAPVMREALAAFASTAPLGSLQGLVDALRAREAATSSEAGTHEWRAARGAVHQALALRGSRLAVYDLRESVEAATEPLPPSFLAALHAVGDASCLDAIAAAHERADDPRWRVQLRDAFQTIARRERLSRRSAVVKRIAAKWPSSGDLWGGPGGSRRSNTRSPS